MLEYVLVGIGVLIVLLILIIVTLIKNGKRIDYNSKYMQYVDVDMKRLKNIIRASGTIQDDDNKTLNNHIKY